MTQTKYTMIRVTKKFADRLKSMKVHPNQSYEEAITSFIERHKKPHEPTLTMGLMCSAPVEALA